MAILVITTGGTIGALPNYDFAYGKEFVSKMPPAGQDMVRDALQSWNLAGVRCISNEPRDSKLMDEPYRQGLLKAIEAAPEKEILITHGTDTILQSADYFYQQCAANSRLAEKTILLTGAMIPLANGKESDGYLNLRFSLEQLDGKKAAAGVYIVLCDYELPDDESSAWKPRLYRFSPGSYEKLYSEDRRFSRLRRVK